MTASRGVGGLRRPEHSTSSATAIPSRSAAARSPRSRPLRSRSSPTRPPARGRTTRSRPTPASATRSPRPIATATPATRSSCRPPTYVLTDTTAGQIVIQNTSSLADKTLTIVGQGPVEHDHPAGTSRGRTGSSRSWARAASGIDRGLPGPGDRGRSRPERRHPRRQRGAGGRGADRRRHGVDDGRGRGEQSAAGLSGAAGRRRPTPPPGAPAATATMQRAAASTWPAVTFP